MKLSRTAIKELTAKYRAVLLKCAILNMAAFTIAMATATPAKADAWSDLQTNIAGGGEIKLQSNPHRTTVNNGETLGNAAEAGTVIKADLGSTISTTGGAYDCTPCSYYSSASGITVGASRSLSLQGLTFTGFNGYDVHNLGTLTLNEVNLGTGVTGTGSTTVLGESTVASMVQKSVTVNGRLAIDANKLTVTNSDKLVTVNGVLAFGGNTGDGNFYSTAGKIDTIANAGSITTKNNVEMANALTGNGSVTVGNTSILRFSGSSNSNTINGLSSFVNDELKTGRLVINNNGAADEAAALSNTGALNISTEILAGAKMTTDANLIGGTTMNRGTLVLTKGATPGTTNQLSKAIINTGRLELNDVVADINTTADANITNTTAALADPNLIMKGDVTLISLMGDGKAQLDARTVNTTLTITGRENGNEISAITANGRKAKIVVHNDGEADPENALTTTGKLLVNTTIDTGSVLAGAADMLGKEGTTITVTNNGTLGLVGGAAADAAKTAYANLVNNGDFAVTDGHVVLAGNLEGEGEVTLIADSEIGTSLTLVGKLNDNTINTQISEDRNARLYIANNGMTTSANALDNTGALNADTTIKEGARLITDANLIGQGLGEGKTVTVTNNGNLVLRGTNLTANTLSRKVEGTGTTTLRENAAVAEGVILDNALEIGTKTLSGDGFAVATGKSTIANGGTISIADLTVQNEFADVAAARAATGAGDKGFFNAGTVSSAKLTIGVDHINEVADKFTLFDNTAATAKITSADLKINELGVLKTAGTKVESATIKNNGTLVLNGATQNTVVDDVTGEERLGTTINEAGASTIATLTQKEVDVEAGSLTVTGTATISTKIDVDAGAALNLTGTTGEADPMTIAAAVENDGNIAVAGKIRINGDVGDDVGVDGVGMIMTAEGAELTLAGLNNTNIVAGNGKLIVKNTGFNSAESTIDEDASLKMRTENSLLIETEIAQNSALVANADALGIDGVPVSVTNNGALNLEIGGDTANMTAYANIVNNGMVLLQSGTHDITVDGAVTNNGKIAVDTGSDVILTGNLTNTSETAGTVTLADDATLTLKGTQNTNDIFGSFTADHESTLYVHNLGPVDAETDKSLTTTGKLFTNVQIDNGWLKAAADRLGGVKPEEEDPTTININNVNGTLALTGSPIPAPAEEGAEVQLGEPLIAYANITNGAGYGTMTDGHIRLNGNLIGGGFVDNSGVLVLGGASNANLIVGTGELVIDNNLTTTGVLRQKVTVNAGKTLTANGADMLGAEGEGNTINVINNGTLALNNTTAAELTAHANIVNNGDLHTFIEGGDDRIVKVDGNVANNGTITVSRNLVITGTLTGEVTDTTGKVNMADNATLTLLGTANTNDIRGNVANPATLIVTNTGVMNAENPADNTALVNTGKVFVNTTVTDASAMITAANLLGKAATTEPEAPATVIAVENNGILALTGSVDPVNPLTAYANITNVGENDLTKVTGAVRLEGNLLGAGTTTLANGAELTLAGTSNTNTIQNLPVEGSVGKLIISNQGATEGHEAEALTTTAALNVATTVKESAKLIANTANLIGAEVTNNGIVQLNGGALNSNIVLSNENADIVIDGDVTSNVALAKATINATKQLTIAAEHVGSFTNNGTVQLRAGNTATFSSALTTGAVKLMDNLTFANGASFGNADSKANLDLNGKTLDIGTNTLTIGTLTGGDASTIKLTLLENATDATLVSTTTANVANVLLDINTAAVSKLDVQHYKVTNAETTGYNVHLSGNPYNYVVSENPFDMEAAMEMARGEAFNFNNWQNHDLYILKVEAVARVAAEKLIESGIGVSQNERGAVATLADDDVYNAMTAGQKASVDRINNMLAVALDSNNEGQAKQILKEVGAEKAPAVAQSEAANVGAVMNVVGSRLGGAAPAPAAAGTDTGRSGGSEFFVGKTAVWGQMMFNTAKLDRTDGFDSDSAGFALGAEYKINDEYKVGFGYAFTSTDLKTDRSKTDVDTHTGFLYGEYKPNNFYVNGVLSFGTSSYDEKTKLTNITADYDATTFGIQAMAGYTFGIITPEAGLRYTNVKQDAYTNSLGVRAGSKTNEMLTAVAGAKYAQAFRVGNDFILTPEARVAMTYDIDRSKQDRSITLANGAGYLSEGQNMNRFGLELGAGVSFKVNNAIDIGVSYEGKFKKDYSDHTGLLNVKYNF